MVTIPKQLGLESLKQLGPAANFHCRYDGIEDRLEWRFNLLPGGLASLWMTRRRGVELVHAFRQRKMIAGAKGGSQRGKEWLTAPEFTPQQVGMAPTANALNAIVWEAPAFQMGILTNVALEDAEVKNGVPPRKHWFFATGSHFLWIDLSKEGGETFANLIHFAVKSAGWLADVPPPPPPGVKSRPNVLSSAVH